MAAPLTASGSRPPSRLTKRAPNAAQRLDDAAHRPAPQRGVAGDEGGDRVGRQDAEEEPRRGAGIAEIEQIFGLGEPADPDAVDQSTGRRRRASTLAPERVQRRGGRQHVLAFEQAR